MSLFTYVWHRLCTYAPMYGIAYTPMCDMTYANMSDSLFPYAQHI